MSVALLGVPATGTQAGALVDYGPGAYSTSGTITRAQLTAGLADRVSDEALDVANSPALAEARAGWDADVDLVGQIDYQLRFRAQSDYLPTDADHLGALLTDRADNGSFESYGLYLTDQELAELHRRLDLGDRIEDVVAAVGGEITDGEGSEPRYDPNFAGAWQDQHDGGAIVVAFVDASQVDRAQLADLVGGEQHLRVLDGQYSWNDVEGFSDAMVAAIRAQGVQAEVRINSTGEGRRLEVVAPDPASIPASVLQLAPPEIVSVTQGPMDAPEGSPSSTHSAADQMPGLNLEFDPGNLAAWAVNGHTSSYNYLVTVGHVGSSAYHNFSGWTDGLEAHQNNSFHLTPGSSFVLSYWIHDYDVKRVSTSYADDNCYHTTADHCLYSIERRALHNSWEINSDMVCATLVTTGQFECGYVTQENYPSTGCDGDRWVRYSIDTSSGDSGAGVVGPPYYQASIDAMHSCGSGTHGMGNTAYDVKTKLAFDFNCASLPSVKAASAWGSCPTVNR